jgi:release factor glutamine methyltransferase
MNIQNAKLFIIDALKGVYDEREAGNIAVLLLEWITQKNKTTQFIEKNTLLTSDQENILHNTTARLQKNEPIQYIIGEAWFMGVPLKVNASTLIPRPETEELVEWILSDLKSIPANHIQLLDIGTGSGCIPISLKNKADFLQIQSVDISADAIDLAKENALKMNTDIDFKHIDFTIEKQWSSLATYHVIVSNPPYIKENERGDMRKNVLDYEPSTALFVPDNNPLIFYEKIKQFSASHLQPNGRIYLEINAQLGQAVVALFTSENCQVDLRKDMQGRDRMVRVIFL